VLPKAFWTLNIHAEEGAEDDSYRFVSARRMLAPIVRRFALAHAPLSPHLHRIRGGPRGAPQWLILVARRAESTGRRRWAAPATSAPSTSPRRRMRR
jgi:hypothetical protein